eukprot:scaffold23126_cov47-Phaeocystis_antarctica.AAC.1
MVVAATARVAAARVGAAVATARAAAAMARVAVVRATASAARAVAARMAGRTDSSSHQPASPRRQHNLSRRRPAAHAGWHRARARARARAAAARAAARARATVAAVGWAEKVEVGWLAVSATAVARERATAG